MPTHDPDFSEKSAAALLGTLTPGEQAEWDALLQRDAQARAIHEELTAMNAILTAHHDAAAPASNFEQRMVGAFRRRAPRESAGHRLVRWLRLPAIAIPAAAAVLAGLVWLGATLTHSPEVAMLAELVPAPAAENKTKVDRLLAEGTAFYERGSYDLATKRSEQVLAIDKYNIAARRLMEKVTATRSQYYAEAYNETRSQLLSQASAGWELPVRKSTSGNAAAEEHTGHPTTTSMSLAKKDGAFSSLEAHTSTEGANGASRESDGTNGEISAFTSTRDNLLAQNSTTSSKTRRADQGAADGEPAMSTAQADARKLIRNARVELVVEAFEPAVKSIADLAAKSGGDLATRDSSRLANGKMRGTLVLKIPPATLDSFLAGLVSLGEVRNQSLGTEDVTKAYFDTEARLRNARRMEESLLVLLENTKGRVSELLEVERELGRVRGQIEEMQGSLKLWDSLAARATVTIQLTEKDLDEAAAYTVRERATLAIQSQDVEKTSQKVAVIAAEAKAQIAQSNLTQNAARRDIAEFRLLLDASNAEATIEKLKTLGRVRDFRSETEQVARDGGGNAPDARVEKERVQLTLTISARDESPAQRTELRLETTTVEQQIAALREFATAKKIEITGSTFQQDPEDGQSARLEFSLPLAGYEAFMDRIRDAGTVKNISVRRNDITGEAPAGAVVIVNVTNPAKLVPSESGLTATLRHTFTQAVGSLMWSLRMIGVAIAFLVPWLLGAGILYGIGRIILRNRKKRP